MFRTRSLIAAVTCLALVCGSVTALADPGNGQGSGKVTHGNQGNKGQGNQGGHGNKNKNSGGGGDWSNGPSINRGSVLEIISVNTGYWSPGPDLPPGIQKNLARGKPLPPGIAKNSMADSSAGCPTMMATNGSKSART